MHYTCNRLCTKHALIKLLYLLVAVVNGWSPSVAVMVIHIAQVCSLQTFQLTMHFQEMEYRFKQTVDIIAEGKGVTQPHTEGTQAHEVMKQHGRLFRETEAVLAACVPL
jgi:hypothetical protein